MLYDVTPTVSPALGVWPGDTPASRTVLLDIPKGSPPKTVPDSINPLGAHDWWRW